MRLNIATVSANEQLVNLINKGYTILSQIKDDYNEKKTKNSYSDDSDIEIYNKLVDEWAHTVVNALIIIFPTEFEKNLFLNPDRRLRTASGDYKFESFNINVVDHIKGLDKIRTDYLPTYTDLPARERLYIEDIDSFQKVRDINHALIMDKLDNGFFNVSEDTVQLAIEQILNVSFHKKDWGGEFNDLYTSNVVVNGIRRTTAFLLKGNGIGKKVMTIADCGKNGDQIVRLFSVAADLFVIQFVGNIADMVIKDIEGKARERKANYLIIDGQDTA